MQPIKQIKIQNQTSPSMWSNIKRQCNDQIHTNIPIQCSYKKLASTATIPTQLEEKTKIYFTTRKAHAHAHEDSFPTGTVLPDSGMGQPNNQKFVKDEHQDNLTKNTEA
jgi:hypothetical protein